AHPYKIHQTKPSGMSKSNLYPPRFTSHYFFSSFARCFATIRLYLIKTIGNSFTYRKILTTNTQLNGTISIAYPTYEIINMACIPLFYRYNEIFVGWKRMLTTLHLIL